MLIRKYISGIAPHIERFIEHKHAFGFKYIENEYHLKKFDVMCATNFPSETTITKDMGMLWAVATPKERREGLSRRLSPVRELARFMCRNDIPAFIIPNECGTFPIRRYSPHIFTESELSAIFNVADSFYEAINYPANHLAIPVLLRLLYACGLRPYEGRLLKRNDINLDDGSIFIPATKKFKERFVVMDDSMLGLCRKYDAAVRNVVPDSEYFFPNSGRGQPFYSRHWIVYSLSRCLINAGLTEFSGNPPRPYDFRHTFATHTLYRWLKEGRNLDNCLVYLSAYMGHENFQHTAYYIHLTPDFYANIPSEITQRLERILPEVGV
jgi:integrase